MSLLSFYKNKTVLITGHTGFKGSWLSKILIDSGANVIGYSLKPPTDPSLFEILNLKNKMHSIIGDIRDFKKLRDTILKYKPSIIFHLAAQPIVKISYENPKYTYETNVLGTLNVLECIRITSFVKSFVNITTDKVYFNCEKPKVCFKEDDVLNGFDPYSNSKSCSELITATYKRSFTYIKCAISTVRAGNVVGGGDFSENRIIPDCFKAIRDNKNLVLRNPHSIRPYQHILEALNLYLIIAKEQYLKKVKSGSYNVGPDTEDCINTKTIVSLFFGCWGKKANIVYSKNIGLHESAYLKLLNNKIKKEFKWKPIWGIEQSIENTVKWYKSYLYNRADIIKETERQINSYFNKK